MSSAPARSPIALARGKLVALLREKGWSNAEAGRLFECAPSYVAMLKSGGATPGLSLAARIEEVTGIPCAEWVTKESGKLRTRIDKSPARARS